MYHYNNRRFFGVEGCTIALAFAGAERIFIKGRVREKNEKHPSIYQITFIEI